MIKKNLNNNINNGHFQKNDDVDLTKVIRIINKRKWILIGSIVFTLTLAFLYNITSKPTYESKVTLKKERTQRGSPTTDQLQKIISLQTADEIETELELVKTSEVLGKAISDLMLFAKVEKIEHKGTEAEYGKSVFDFNNYYIKNIGNSSKYPHIFLIKMSNPVVKYDAYIERRNDEFILADKELNSVISIHKIKPGDDTITFVNSNILLKMLWQDAVPGSKVFVKINSLNEALKSMETQVTVEQKNKTDVFDVKVRAESPSTAQKIASTITDHFRQARIDQQKQTIRYSFDFVDKNLDDIKAKLEEAEANLTNFKSANQIMDIQGSSQDLVQFISNLEAEKLNTELELTEYQNKYDKMKAEHNNKGFFDQTFLSPQGNEPTNSPFSNLMRQKSDLELQKLELLNKRKENHPDVIAIDRQLAQVNKTLSGYNNNTLTSYDIIINSLQKKENRLNDMMGRYESKMQTLPAQENKLASLIRQQNVYQKMYTLLLDKREEMRMAELSKLQDIIIVDPANEPLEPVTPRKTFNLIAGFILGLFFGFMGVFIAEFVSKRKISLDEIENDLHLPIYAIIPEFSKDLLKKVNQAKDFNEKFVTLMHEQDGYKESYRVLRTKLLSSLGEKRIIMLTSCEENTGKTTIVANLGISLALAKKKILLIDCDLKKGTLSNLFNIENDVPGMISFLKRKIPQPNIYNKAIPGLDIIPAGGISESSGDLLGTDRMKNLLNMIESSNYDYILIDTPPVTRVVDTLVMSKYVKDVVLIVRPEYTFKDSVEWGLQELQQEGATIQGTVINAGNIEKSSFKYRYGYGYGYGYGNKQIKLELSKT